MLEQAAAKAHQCYRRAVLCVERAQDAGDELSRKDWLDRARFWVAVAKSYTIPDPVEQIRPGMRPLGMVGYRR